MQVRIQTFWKLLMFGTSLVLFTGCGPSSDERFNVLVVAIDRLNFTEVTCPFEANSTRRGFPTLCNEFVRFTHAYTPSTLSAPALASLLTGQYPFDHKLHHHGSQFLSAKFRTIAEVAVANGYRTSLFSGSAPIVRTTGLQQGFETFDDNFPVSAGLVHRPIEHTMELLQRWISTSSKPFFSLVYVPDFRFRSIATRNALGEWRNLSFEGQLEELDQNLGDLFTFLQTKKLWKNTHIVVVGLNGRSSTETTEEIEPLNLHSEVTQVALFIKGLLHRREAGLAWGFDRSISLVDLGATLFQLFGEAIPKSSVNQLNSVSLKDLLESTDINWPSSHLVYSESSWGDWHGLTSARYSLRDDRYLTIRSQDTELFNTLTDRFERTPISALDSSVAGYMQQIFPLLNILDRKLGIDRPRPGISWRLSALLQEEPWTFPQRGYRMQALNQLAKYDKGEMAQGLYAFELIRQGDWQTLKSLNHPDWSALADLHLKVKKPKKFSNACLALLVSEASDVNSLKLCEDRRFTQFLEIIHNSLNKGSTGEREVARRRLNKIYALEALERRLYEWNLSLGGIWNLYEGLNRPPTAIEIAFHLPKFEKLRGSFEKELAPIVSEHE